MAFERPLFGDQRDRLWCRMSTAANESKRSVTAANGFLAWLGHGLNAGTVRYFAHFGKEALPALSDRFPGVRFLDKRAPHLGERATWHAEKAHLDAKSVSARDVFASNLSGWFHASLLCDLKFLGKTMLGFYPRLPHPHSHFDCPARNLTPFTQRPWRL